MSESDKPSVGDVIVYTDEFGVEHDALVIAYFGGERPDGALNCVYTSSEASKSDPYGRQIERACSVSRRHDGLTAHARFWEPKA